LNDRFPQPPGFELAQPVGRNILLVDDHLDTNDALKILLERRGYKVKTATTLRAALDLARTESFDLLISDIGLPDGSGLDLIQRLREWKSSGQLKHIGELRAIAMSGYCTEQDIERSRRAGFLQHLTKPINFPQLEAVVRDVLTS
jgi:two-component system, chemotaxis family, CheB/CheR fusion protein